MAKVAFATVDDYISAQPEPVQPILARVRSAIRKAVPLAAESISYHMPTYKLQGEVLLYFAGWKQHYSLYPATDGVLQAFREELSEFKVEKGTIRFPLTRAVPVRLIASIAKQRAQELGAHAKRPAPTSRSR